MKNKQPPSELTAAVLQQIAAGVTALRKNDFDTLSQAAVYCAAAIATAAGQPLDVSEIRRSTGIPITTVSRVLWGLNQRGLVTYVAHATDRRKRLVHAKLEAFK